MKMTIIKACIINVLVWSAGFAIENEVIWSEAAEFYDNGNYSKAIESYSRLFEKGFSAPELYYNLGNSYFKNGQYGRSIWAYRRALLLEPDLQPAKTNLEFARGMNLDKIEIQEGGFITDIWDLLTGLFSYNLYLIIFAVSWWLLGGIAALVVYRGNFASWPYYLLIVCLIIAIFSVTAAARRIKLDRLTTWGVLVVKAADIREGPGEDFERIEIGHEGLEFRILSEREDSYLVELKNGLKGWIDKKAVLEI